MISDRCAAASGGASSAQNLHAGVCAMFRKILIGMLGFFAVCVLAAAGYRVGQQLAGHDGGTTGNAQQR